MIDLEKLNIRYLKITDKGNLDKGSKLTQRGSWCPSGDLGNSSKPIIKGYMEKNMKNRLIMFKTFTKVELYGETDEINITIENLMTIALWEFRWSNVFNPFYFENNWGMYVSMATVKGTLKWKLLFLLEINLELFYFRTLELGSQKDIFDKSYNSSTIYNVL